MATFRQWRNRPGVDAEQREEQLISEVMIWICVEWGHCVHLASRDLVGLGPREFARRILLAEGYSDPGGMEALGRIASKHAEFFEREAAQ